MDNKPVFVATFAEEDCSHCREFKKNHWINVQQGLSKLPMTVVTVELGKRSVKPGQRGFPDDLERYIGWYPTFALFTAKSWKQRGVLEGTVLNSRRDDMGLLVSNPTYNLDRDGIVSWVENQLRTNSLFTSGSGNSSIIPPRNIPTTGSMLCRTKLEKKK